MAVKNSSTPYATKPAFRYLPSPLVALLLKSRVIAAKGTKITTAEYRTDPTADGAPKCKRRGGFSAAHSTRPEPGWVHNLRDGKSGDRLAAGSAPRPPPPANPTNLPLGFQALIPPSLAHRGRGEQWPESKAADVNTNAIAQSDQASAVTNQLGPRPSGEKKRRRGAAGASSRPTKSGEGAEVHTPRKEESPRRPNKDRKTEKKEHRERAAGKNCSSKCELQRIRSVPS